MEPEPAAASSHSFRLSRPKYSRLTVRRKAKDDSVVGLLSLFDPLGFLEEGRDLVVCYREASAAREAAHALSESRIRCELVTDIPEGDPFEMYRAACRPFPVGRRLWIDPREPSDSAPPEGRIALRLPASRAFGTGQHASTRLALLALEEEPLEGETVLDAGTGSGVLALAALALGARRAVGYDTDLAALLIARENRLRHPFGSRLALVAGPTESISGSFPLVVANLLPDEFFPISRSLLLHVARRGRLIISGIPEDREEEMLSRLRRRRWQLVGRHAEEGWTCVSLQRA